MEFELTGKSTTHINDPHLSDYEMVRPTGD
jgi:hypothetical protein